MLGMLKIVQLQEKFKIVMCAEFANFDCSEAVSANSAPMLRIIQRCG